MGEPKTLGSSSRWAKSKHISGVNTTYFIKNLKALHICVHSLIYCSTSVFLSNARFLKLTLDTPNWATVGSRGA